ncbi:MAG: B3/4 domain-containing protein [Promethearchaeota archaeon]
MDQENPRISFKIDRPGLSISLIIMDELKVGRSSLAFEEYEQEIFEVLRAQTTLNQLKDDPLLRSYRDLYWTFGMDPTKLRVSSEAVLRRILRGLNLWRISDVVDIVNLASAYHKIPIGLVDASRSEGDLVVRSARNGEIFERIGGKTVECRGREIVVSDDLGLVCFGYATNDSERTKVRNESTRVYVILYGAAAVTAQIMEDANRLTLDMIDQWLNCKVSQPRLFYSNT